MKNVRAAALLVYLGALGSLSIQAQVTGSGATNYIPIWASSSSLTNSKLYQADGNVGVGTTSPSYPIDVNGDINTSTVIRIAGAQVLGLPGALTLSNIAVGAYAMFSNTTGSSNTAVGQDSLYHNTTGILNTAVGTDAMLDNTTGSYNTAVGSGAMTTAASGSYNTAIGNSALTQATGDYNTASGYASMVFNQGGSENTASGYYALQYNVTGNNNTAQGALALRESTGSNNTAVGYGALETLATGTDNIALGHEAGYSVLGSNNIDIGNEGTSTDSRVVRIGTAGNQTKFFAAGIHGATTGASNAVPVVIDSNGQLGTVSSSIRFKEDVHDMSDASSRLVQLRPVTYRYKQPYADGSQPVDYGLIAEEVAQVYPDLVVMGADGQPETVQYQKLTPMLLNELIKEHRLVEQQAEAIKLLEKRLAALEAK
jgi:hypothetical protein